MHHASDLFPNIFLQIMLVLCNVYILYFILLSTFSIDKVILQSYKLVYHIFRGVSWRSK